MGAIFDFRLIADTTQREEQECLPALLLINSKARHTGVDAPEKLHGSGRAMQSGPTYFTALLTFQGLLLGHAQQLSHSGWADGGVGS